MQKVADKYKVTHDANLSTAKFHDTAMDEGELASDAQKRWLRGVNGSLGYAAYRFRPDLAVGVAKLQERQENPTVGCIEAAENLLQYSRKTKGRIMRWMFAVQKGVSVRLALRFYSDADYAARKSRMGVTVELGYWVRNTVVGKTGACETDYQWNCVASRTGKQKVISTSTTEAEVISISWAAKLCMGFRNLLLELIGVMVIGPVPIFGFNDNIPAVLITQGLADIRRVRHMVIAMLYALQLTREKVLHVQHMPGVDMPADALTKVLSQTKHEEHFYRMGFRDLMDAKMKATAIRRMPHKVVTPISKKGKK